MTKVSRIDWTIRTASTEGSGTDAHTRIEIYRDGALLANIFDESGETFHLDRGENATRGWTFENTSGVGTAVSGNAVPYTEDFPSGVAGHLTVTFRIYGDDAWRPEFIESTVTSGEMRFIPGTIDAWDWVTSEETFSFDTGADGAVLSTDTNEGVTSWTLNY